MVYGTPVMSEEDLIARVQGAIESLTRQPHLLGRVCETQHRKCRLCNDVGGTQFVCRLLDVLHMFGLLTWGMDTSDALQSPNREVPDRGSVF